MIDKIRAARRAGRVGRYHTHQLLHREDVAQHTFNVMNLLLTLCHGNVSQNLLLAALMHDQGEYCTGDIPSPIKRQLDDESKSRIHDMEYAGVSFIHHRGFPELTEWEAKLLKLADNLDGWLKTNEEVKLGNDDIRDVRTTYALYILDALDDIKGNISVEVYKILDTNHD